MKVIIERVLSRRYLRNTSQKTVVLVLTSAVKRSWLNHSFDSILKNTQRILLFSKPNSNICV